MLAALLFWEETHRTLIIGVIGLAFWVATNLIYFRGDIHTYLARRRASRWSVDMATRQVTAGRKPVA